MVNGNSGVVGIASDLIGNIKDQLVGAEGLLTDVNMLNMTRPLATINIASQLKDMGGIIPSLQTGAKNMKSARKGGRTGASQQPARRYRPPTSPPASTSQGVEQPGTLEIIL